jgi:hypothetical protein
MLICGPPHTHTGEQLQVGQEGDPSSTECAKRRKKRTSLYWKHFEEVYVDDTKLLQCNLCTLQIAFTGNTSGMKSHLCYHHPDQLAEMLAEAGEGATEASNSQKLTLTVPPWPSSKTSHLHRKLSFWVTKRDRPFSICEDPELRDAFAFATAGAYCAPDHKTIREVHKHYLALLLRVFTPDRIHCSQTPTTVAAFLFELLF